MTTTLNQIVKTLKQWSPLSLPLANSNQSALTRARMENLAQRIKLAAAYRALDAYGLNEGVCNHLSALAPARSGDGTKVMLIIAYGLHWSEVTPTNLLGLNEQNEVVEGTGTVEISATCIHSGVYKARPDVKSVMHTHMPYATCLSCLKDPTIKMVHQNSARFLNRVAYDRKYGGVAHLEEEGKRIANVLGTKDVMIMGNHGVLTVGSTIAIAFDHMYYLERAAHVQVLAMSTGAELEIMSKEVQALNEAEFWRQIDKYTDAHLEAVRRKLSVQFPEFTYI